MAAGDVTRKSARVQLLGDDADTIRALGALAGGALFTAAHFAVTSQRDATANDSDKTFTVPAGTLWWIHGILIDYSATSTVGNRSAVAHFRDTADNLILAARYSSNITAGQNRIISFHTGGANATGNISKHVLAGIPNRLILPAGYDVRVHDAAAIDAAADDMTVALLYDQFTV